METEPGKHEIASEDPISPVSPTPKPKNKRKGNGLESSKKKKQKKDEKLVVKSKAQLLDAIEKKKNFELYSSYQRVDLIDPLIGPSGAKLLGDALENAQIVELSLAGNHLPSHHMAPILASLKKLTSLESLDLSRNKLSDIDAQLIWKLLATNSTLTRLDLSENTISLNGAWVIEPLRNVKLCTLVLSENPIGDTGLSFLVIGLLHNTRLEKLELQDIQLNRVWDLVGMLKTNTTLTCLDLAGNPIGTKCGTFCDALRSNKTLVELNMQNTDLSLAGLCKFIDLLRQNATLRYVHVAKNGLPVTLKKAFRQLLATRRELRVINDIADESEVSFNDETETELAETEELEEEQACNTNLCDWPEYKQLKIPAFEQAADFLASHPEVRIDVVVPNEADTHTMKKFYDEATEKLRGRLEELKTEAEINDKELTNIAEPLQEKEQSLNELVQQYMLLEIQINNLRKQLDEYQIEFLKKKIPAILSEDILKAVEVNADLLQKRLRDNDARLELNKTKMQRPLGEWSVADVAVLLKELNIAQYADKFTSSAITGSVLVNLNTLDLMQDLCMDWKHAKKLQKAIFLLNHRRSIYEQSSGVFEWSTDDTCQWLVSVGFEKYSPAFVKHKVTGQELLLIDKYDLSRVFKIESLVDKVTLEREIKTLVLKEEPANKKDPSLAGIKQAVKEEKCEGSSSSSTVNDHSQREDVCE